MTKEIKRDVKIVLELSYYKQVCEERSQFCRERDEARAEVERLREHVTQLLGALHGQSAVAFAVEHVAKGRAAGADALRTVAERQREACAKFVESLDECDVEAPAYAATVRDTPLVTEGEL